MDVVAFLEHLLAHVGGEIVVVFDRALIHRARAVKAFLESERGSRITVEHLPA